MRPRIIGGVISDLYFDFAVRNAVQHVPAAAL
jgi:hypothetical protein